MIDLTMEELICAETKLKKYGIRVAFDENYYLVSDDGIGIRDFAIGGPYDSHDHSLSALLDNRLLADILSKKADPTTHANRCIEMVQRVEIIKKINDPLHNSE